MLGLKLNDFEKFSNYPRKLERLNNISMHTRKWCKSSFWENLKVEWHYVFSLTHYLKIAAIQYLLFFFAATYVFYTSRHGPNRHSGFLINEFVSQIFTPNSILNQYFRDILFIWYYVNDMIKVREICFWPFGNITILVYIFFLEKYLNR